MAPTELKPIILYDIPCITPGRPWSPNTIKTRYSLAYKRLPFTTVWVEFPDIMVLHQSKGITHPPYTLPAIEDPNTGAFIMDSLTIATYLDDTYPETPRVLNHAARALLEKSWDVLAFRLGGSAATGTNMSAGTGAHAAGGVVDLGPRLVFVVLAADRLNPVSKTYCDQTRPARFGEQWTTMRDACSASPEARAELVRQGIEAIREFWREATALYDHAGDSESDRGEPGGPFVLGKEPCFVDFAVAGRIHYILDGLVASEVEIMTNLGGGRLTGLIESLEKYYIH